LVLTLGFDPIWFGVVMMLLIAMGMVFPPVGIAAFIVSAGAKVKLATVYKGTSILTISVVVTTLLIMLFPELALWLPHRMR
ncbi:MAG: TRAP transporter large permease subunit, partial [Deltaproteobacteria bacterium]|nr:TRAP transporter large permease subunit [Deltaproteobacteria bacterium]